MTTTAEEVKSLFKVFTNKNMGSHLTHVKYLEDVNNLGFENKTQCGIYFGDKLDEWKDANEEKIFGSLHCVQESFIEKYKLCPECVAIAQKYVDKMPQRLKDMALGKI